MRPEYHKLIMADSMLAAAALIVFIVWGWQAAVCILFSALVLSSVFVSEIRRREAQASSLSDEIDVFFMGKNTGIWTNTARESLPFCRIKYENLS